MTEAIESINASTHPRSLNGIVHMATLQPGDDLPQLNLSPLYQRSSVWSPEQRRRMIKAILRGIQLPSLYLNAPDGRRSVEFNVVDGKQRIETLLAFVAGEFSIPTAWITSAGGARAPVQLPDGWNSDEIRFTDLTASEQSAFLLSHTIGVIETELPTVEAEAQLYLDLNESGSAQTPQDLNRARNVAQGIRDRDRSETDIRDPSTPNRAYCLEWIADYVADGGYIVLVTLDKDVAERSLEMLEDRASRNSEFEGAYMLTDVPLIDVPYQARNLGR